MKRARLCFRVVVEAVARKRCGEDVKQGLATHCGVSVKEMDTILEAAKTEGLIDNSMNMIREA